jgi:hypothetical protein
MLRRSLVVLGRLLLTLLCIQFHTRPAQADDSSAVQVTDVHIEYTFDVQLNMNVTFASEIPIVEAALFLQQDEQPEIGVGPVGVNSDGKAVFIHDLAQHPLRPFSTVLYWFAVTLQNGEHHFTPKYQFFYQDNRFDWQTIEGDIFRVHWYQGNVISAQEILSVAQKGRMRAQNLLSQDLTGMVDIYVYDNPQALQAALRLTAQKWVAGQAYPDVGVILVSLPDGPEKNLEMERQIPHELMHLMLFQKTGKNYVNLPLWLAEGLASVNELYPNPDYQIILEDAYQNERLLPLSSLCRSFPNETAEALLAYAESASFVRFLQIHYDSSGLEKLVLEYVATNNCEQGIEHALGASLTQMESRWKREVFSKQTRQNRTESLIPWLVLMMVVLAAPLILSIVLLRQKITKPVGG